METFNRDQSNPTFIRAWAKLKSNGASPLISRWLSYCYSDIARRYLQQYAKLFSSSISLGQIQIQPVSDPSELVQPNSTADLVVYEESLQPWLKQLLFGPPVCQLIKRLATSTLVIRQPRWPIRHILFVTRGQPLDDGALTWLLPLLQMTQSQVTVLAVQPYLTTIDSRALCGNGLAAWLSSDTSLGRQLQLIVNAQTNELKLQLRFLSGSPYYQIQEAVELHQPDLIVITADSPRWYERRIPGTLVNPLLGWIDRPVLVIQGHS